MATYPAILMSGGPPVATKHLLPLHASELCRVYFRMMTVAGQPARNLVVAFASTYNLPIVGRAGVSGDPVEAQTDEHGDGEIELPRGLVVEVSIYGTGYSRVVTIPDQAEQDLFYLLTEGQDVFSVQIADVINAPRRSL